LPDPSDLLDAARVLMHSASSLPLTEARMRRAVSTAYYAVFHKVLQAGAEHFMGTFYRSPARISAAESLRRYLYAAPMSDRTLFIITC
jgi:hypothetical protein